MNLRVKTVIGIFLVLYMLLYSVLNNFNMGILVPMVFGIILIIWNYLPENRVFSFLKAMFCVFSVIYIGLMVFLGIAAHTDTTGFDEDAIIVLGCGLKGSVPSGNLSDRLEKAIDYSDKNPSALIVVSGGQGLQEKCSEAEAMYKYLVDRGVGDSRILKEDKSSSTNENFRYSKKILDSTFTGEYKVAYITNTFHSYRAGKIAELNGLNALPYNAPTHIFSVVPNYAREVLALIQLWIFNK